MTVFLPISENDLQFSVNFFRKISTEMIERRLDEQNIFTVNLSYTDMEKYVNDYFAMMQVLQERGLRKEQNDKIRNI